MVSLGRLFLHQGGGMRTLRMSALRKLKDGITSLEEVMRVTGHD